MGVKYNHCNVTDDSIAVPVAGRYQINLKFAWEANATGSRCGSILINGTVIEETCTTDRRFYGEALTSDLSAGDKISVSVFQNSTVTLDINPGPTVGSNYCRINIRRV
jgi:hypothetical protein